MKNHIKSGLLIVLIFVFGNLYSQNWPAPDAKWTYCLFNSVPAGELIVEVVGDTVIENRTYTIVGQTQTNKISDDVDPLRVLYTRYENDTVYRYVNNQEYLYFAFNLNVGDVFTTFRSSGWMWNDSSCSSVLPLKVIEINEVELNGEIFNSYIIEDTLFQYLFDDSVYPELVYNLIDRIGVINTLPFINVGEDSGWPCMILTDYGEVELGHYSDNNFQYLFKECEGVGVDLLGRKQSEFYVYPNPVDDLLFIEQNKNTYNKYIVSIIDVFGQEQLSMEMNSTKLVLNISELPPKFYILCIRDKSHQFTFYKTPIIKK
jgi:hypothetical protein